MSGAAGDRRPFRRLDGEVLVSNPWHRYCRDRYIQADGSEGVYYYVDMAGSCGVIPVFDDGSTMLLSVRRYLLGVDLWEFPIGGMKPGEEPFEVAARELHEEAGLAAADWAELGYFAPYKGVSNERCWFFLARGITQLRQQLEPSERIVTHRLPFAEARRRLVEQECGDGQSLAGLMLLERWLQRGNTL
ncbi:MAG: NUDIX hydrolase [Planctomycetes bacterium]|nr:NUDIX hydrolase [Planctomycetota bacterium]